MKLTPIGPNQTEVELTTASGDTVTLFFSYETLVALHIEGSGTFKTAKYWSKTTSRHINQWLKLHGDAPSKNVEQDILEALVTVNARQVRLNNV